MKLKQYRKRSTLALLIALGFSHQVKAVTDTWVSNGNSTVIDLATGLIWQQTSDDQLRTYADSIRYCENLGLAGFSDWRLPNVKELSSIIDFRTDDPALDVNAFSEPSPNRYWSITTSPTAPALAWGVSFRPVLLRPANIEQVSAVRCVR